MCHCSAEVFEGHHFIGDRFDDFWTGDEHVSRLVNHDDKIRDGRRIDCATCAGAHNDRNLWDDPRRTHVSEEDFSITSQRCYAFLNTSPT